MSSADMEFRWEWMSAPVAAPKAKASEEWTLFEPKIQALLNKAVQNKSSNVSLQYDWLSDCTDRNTTAASAIVPQPYRFQIRSRSGF